MAPRKGAASTTEETQTVEVSAYAELGLSGLRHTGGYVTEEFLTSLKGTRALRIYKEMSENDAVIGGILFVIDNLVRQVTWTPQGDNDDWVSFVQENMDDMSMTWADFISEVCTMFPYGYSWFETVYKRREGFNEEDEGASSKYSDGRIGWRKHSPRAQSSFLRWELDETGGIIGMWQVAAPDYTPRLIPIEKSLLFRTRSHKNNPEGYSILRNAYRSWYFKKRIEEIEAIGVERDLAGYPLLYMDPKIMEPNAPADVKRVFDEYKEMIRNIRRDQQEGSIIPSVFDKSGNRLISLELISAGGTRQFDTGAIIERYARNEAMSVLADFIMLGHESVGSFALSADKTEMFAVALGAWLRSIAAVINDYAIPRLLRLNGAPDDVTVEIVPGDIEQLPLETIMSSLTQMAALGFPVAPNEELQRIIFERMGLPMQTEVEATQVPEPAPAEDEPFEGE